MPTDPSKAHKFALKDDPVPGIGTYVQQDKNLDNIELDSVGNTSHVHPYGTQDAAVLMPQGRIRLKAFPHNTSAPANGSLSFTQSPCDHSDCTDEYRYWPAYRASADDNTLINKFSINTAAGVGCDRWSNWNKSASDEGAWAGTTQDVDNDPSLMNIANPGFCTNYESSDDDWARGTEDELDDFESNYNRAFKIRYAPGWEGNAAGTTTCCKYTAVDFNGTSNPWDMNKWGFFISDINTYERGNIMYNGTYYHAYGNNRCDNKQTCGDIFWSTTAPSWEDYAIGGCPDDPNVGVGQNPVTCPGKNWKDPAGSSRWPSSDICDCLDQGADMPSLFNAVTGAYEYVVDRDDRIANCLRCVDGWWPDGNDINSDPNETCQKFCIDEGYADGDTIEIQVKDPGGNNSTFKSNYFANENIYYHVDYLDDELK